MLVFSMRTIGVSERKPELLGMGMSNCIHQHHLSPRVTFMNPLNQFKSDKVILTKTYAVRESSKYKFL